MQPGYGNPPTAGYGAGPAMQPAMQPGYGQQGDYAAMPMSKGPPSAFAPGRRRKINGLAIAVNIFLPWFLFSALYSIQSFTFHYTHPATTLLVVISAFIIPLVTGIWALVAKRREMDLPMWYTYFTFASLLAVGLAICLGDMNFWYNMQPYYDMQNLNTYPSVNPAREKGQQLMDSGRVYFSPGTRLNLKMAMGFKHHDMYCVAPIVNGNEKLPTYDFWAVGTNCCAGATTDYRCGEFNNPHARSAFRLMNDDQRPFFRLAVQQAESAYNLKATHPIFLHWMQDPVDSVNAYRDDGNKYFLMGVFSHFLLNAFCVASAVVGFSKMGHY